MTKKIAIALVALVASVWIIIAIVGHKPADVAQPAKIEAPYTVTKTAPTSVAPIVVAPKTKPKTHKRPAQKQTHAAVQAECDSIFKTCFGVFQ